MFVRCLYSIAFEWQICDILFYFLHLTFRFMGKFVSIELGSFQSVNCINESIRNCSNDPMMYMKNSFYIIS